MDIQLDQEYLLRVMKELIETPSPVSYYEETDKVMRKLAEELGYDISYDRKRTNYIKVKGKNREKTVCVGAHLDTLGFMIRRIDPDGMIRVRNLGGINFNNIEGESVIIHTRDGKRYTGLAACQYHSVHVFDEARTAPRNENTMMILLDEDVHSREEVEGLGICNGDIVSLEPHFTVTENGFIKSRFIDDKACAACVFALLKAVKDQNLTPAFDTWFVFPYYEEIGHGGAYVPEEVSEYVALDIALIGPDNNGSEFGASVCVKDNYSPYDRELTGRLLELAKKYGINCKPDVFFHYGTDANAAIRSGNNLYAAAFGMGTFSSHGVERTHIDGVMATARLLAAYVLEG
ncbi:MAG TPA: M42 family metallopeptidase [Candidatus Hungatella pullicola]|nr:M42 family metallopeptidase [Candidatus Hungatella pullicola]